MFLHRGEAIISKVNVKQYFSCHTIDEHSFFIAAVRQFPLKVALQRPSMVKQQLADAYPQTGDNKTRNKVLKNSNVANVE